jgi:hypothetical protein
MALIVGSRSAPDGWSTSMLAAGVAAIGALIAGERKHLGVRFNRNRLIKGNRLLMLAYLVGAIVVMIGAAVANELSGAWWPGAVAALGLGLWAAWVMYRSDEVLTDDLRDGR